MEPHLWNHTMNELNQSVSKLDEFGEVDVKFLLFLLQLRTPATVNPDPLHPKAKLMPKAKIDTCMHQAPQLHRLTVRTKIDRL